MEWKEFLKIPVWRLNDFPECQSETDDRCTLYKVSVRFLSYCVVMSERAGAVDRRSVRERRVSKHFHISYGNAHYHCQHGVPAVVTVCT
ncbi:MAG: hypothetical protein J6A75_12710, partial [Lachnospiraceae bacterium]|nr:hypothetical protein [Lachnospiraceae bacterium]